MILPPTLQQLKDTVTRLSGARAVGVARCEPVEEEVERLRRLWIAEGCHAEMKYLERYSDIRRDPRLLLPGTQSIIMTAFGYANPEAAKQIENSGAPIIAEYALGEDYHVVIRKRLEDVARELTSTYGGETRVCVDTAPLRERYWAQRAGLGFIGLNNYLIIPGEGAHFYLGAILWTEKTSDGFDKPCNKSSCHRCGACVAACPNGALSVEGRLDARRCLSYLTIEHRGELPHGINLANRLFGCDICRRVCPHQSVKPDTTAIAEFQARKEIVSLTRDDWENMSPGRFNALFRNSAVRRAKLSKLLDTLKHINSR